MIRVSASTATRRMAGVRSMYRRPLTLRLV